MGLVIAGAACLAVLRAPEPVRDPQPVRGARPDQRPVRAGRHGQARPGRHLRLALLPRHAHLGARLAAAARGGRRRRARAAARLAQGAAARRLPGLLLPLHGRAGPLLRPLAAADLPGALRARGLRRGGRRGRAAHAPGGRARRPRRCCCASRGCWRASTSTACSAARTRGRRRSAGSTRTCPPRARIVVEPFVPASWRDALERPVFPVERPFQAYEKRLRGRPHRPLPRPRLLLGRRRQPPEGAAASRPACAARAATTPRSTRRARTRSRSRPTRRAPSPWASPTTAPSTTGRERTSGRARWSRSTTCATAPRR